MLSRPDLCLHGESDLRTAEVPRHVAPMCARVINNRAAECARHADRPFEAGQPALHCQACQRDQADATLRRDRAILTKPDQPGVVDDDQATVAKVADQDVRAAAQDTDRAAMHPGCTRHLFEHGRRVYRHQGVGGTTQPGHGVAAQGFIEFQPLPDDGTQRLDT